MENQELLRRSLRGWIHGHRHFWWTLCLLPILCFYFIPEWLVVDEYTVTTLALDARIPFLPAFVYAYLLWFVMLFGMGFWLLLRDGDGFRRYMWFLTEAYFICAVIYLCWPNGQDLRPANLAVDSPATWLLSCLYRMDTNTNVFPSLHVVGSVGAAFAACTTPTIPSRWVRTGILLLAALVSISTVFVKQHAVLDVLAGAALGLVLYPLISLLDRKVRQKI